MIWCILMVLRATYFQTNLLMDLYVLVGTFNQIVIVKSSQTFIFSSSLKPTKQGLGTPKNNSVWPMSAESPDPLYFIRV